MIEISSVIPYKGVRKVIGKKMEISNSVPLTYQGLLADVTNLVTLRKKTNDAGNEKLSFNDFIVRAAAIALTRTPVVNSAFIDEQIIVYKPCNISVITAVESGLIGPVIREAQAKSIFEIAQESRELFEKARAGTLMPEYYSEGTFSITNIGMLNIDSCVPLVYPPQAAILGVCSIRKMPVVVQRDNEDTVMIRSMVNLVIAADHRILDGVPMAKFLNDMKQLLENPDLLLEPVAP
ncbi:MAG: 2-oxo acid dehydrogenase subunit E2 [Christensenellales bacterium]